jgi:uncharacterized membrane protein YfcA
MFFLIYFSRSRGINNLNMKAESLPKEDLWKIRWLQEKRSHPLWTISLEDTPPKKDTLNRVKAYSESYQSLIKEESKLVRENQSYDKKWYEQEKASLGMMKELEMLEVYSWQEISINWNSIWECRKGVGGFMNVLEFTTLIWLGSLAAGFLGSLTGLGGGVVIVPLLALGFGVDIRYAIGASLVSVIATSSGAAAAYVKEGFSNIRIGMFLEMATTLGALVGAVLASKVSNAAIAVVFGIVLIHSAYLSGRTQRDALGDIPPDPLAQRLRLDASYPTADGLKAYRVRAIPGGFSLMFVAGALSGLLGIGSGAVKVIGMDQIMRIPFKVSTATSNFMIGVTAAASAGVYLNRGYVDPGLAMPVMLGVLVGSLLGARVLLGARTRLLRLIFSALILALGVEMIYHGLTGRL